MKRTVFILFTLLLGLSLLAQQRIPVNRELTKMSITRAFQPVSEVDMVSSASVTHHPGSTKDARIMGDETEIIETVYDLQTNAALGGRFIVFNDGTMAAVCTRGVENPSGFAFPDRGTGYNYFNGTSWGPKPTARIETVRTGWPSVAKWGPNGEIVVAHRGGTLPLAISTRQTKGTGSWNQIFYNGPGGTGSPQYLWPRMTTTGPNNEFIHLFALTTPSANGGTPWLGQDGCLLYNRSQDGGVTWDIQHQLLAGMGSDYYTNFMADDYVVASKGNTVVLMSVSAWKDLFLMKSTDNGNTWQKIMIWEHPYPFFDFNTTLMPDTLYAVDNSANMAIDNNGIVHVVFGISRVARLASNPPAPGYYSYWPYTDGIGYWNETMGQIPDAPNVHHTLKPEYLETMGMLIGWTQDVNNSGFIFDYEGTASPPFAVYRSLGISTMPTIAINGNMIAMAYSSVTETYVTADGTMNYKHIWMRFSYDKGQTWGPFFDIQSDNIFHLFDECIYPVLAPSTNAAGAFQLIYQADNIPGLYLDEDHDPVINRVIHNSLNFTVGMEKPAILPVHTAISPLYPNPASSQTEFSIQLTQTAHVSAEIFTTTGQKSYVLPAKLYPAGIHTLKIDLSSLKPGVYLVRIEAGNERSSQKLIIQ